MSSLITAPSLDGFLRVHGLTMASFDGKSIDEALHMTGLNDRALENLGGAHCARSLQVRGALLDRLARAKADNNDSDPNPFPDDYDHSDDDDKGDDTPTRKKGKKKTKAKEQEPVEDDPDREDEDTSEPDTPKRPIDNSPDRDARYATDDRVLAMEIRAGMPMTAAQVHYCARKARGQVAPPVPSAGPQPGFYGQESTDPAYWRRVNRAARAIIDVHNARHARKER